MKESNKEDYQDRLQSIQKLVDSMPRKNKRKLLKHLKQDYTSILYSKLKYRSK